MSNTYIPNQSQVIESLVMLSDEIETELKKESNEIDNKKLLKLRNKQLIKGMYLTQIPFYNNK